MSNLPKTMTLGGNLVGEHEISDCFADFFVNKIDLITNAMKVNDSVYNGSEKMRVGSVMFMSTTDIEKSIKGMKKKICEGFDRIPQRIIIDGGSTCCNP